MDFCLAKNISFGKKNIRKNLSSKCNQKLYDHAKQSATDTVKTASKRAIQKTVEATGDLIGLQKSQKVNHIIVQRQLKLKQKIL